MSSPILIFMLVATTGSISTAESACIYLQGSMLYSLMKKGMLELFLYLHKIVQGYPFFYHQVGC